MRRAALVFALLLSACVGKHEPVRVASPLSASVAVVLDAEQERAVLDTPEYLRAAVVEQLREHNLATSLVGVETVAEGFNRLRATPHRLAHLAEVSPADILVLVETRARFESRLQGARRWTVSARITAVRSHARDLPAQADLETPVFLRFEFEDEGEALRDATPVIVKRLSRVVDELLEVLVGSEAAYVPPPRIHPADAVYFVMVDRFADGLADPEGSVDPADPQGFHGGDLPGLIARLDHLQQLGVGAVWLSPVFAMRDAKIGEHGAFHGYWTTDPYAVEPRFGTEADLRRLSDELHRRGMKLYLDFVANHVGYDAPLVAQKPGWFHGLGDIEDWDDPVEATTHDVHGLPDLAHENPEVREWLLDAGRHWIDAVNPDGFRLDAVRHVPLEFWAEFNDAMRAAAGDDFVLLGEMFDGNPGVLARVGTEGRFSHLFDFPLRYAVVDAICGGAPLGRVAAALTSDWAARSGTTPVTFADNHDLPRILSECGGDAARATAALDVLLTARGVPCVTYGTEAGLDGAGEPENRADMRWTEHALGAALRDGLWRRKEHPSLITGTTVVEQLSADRIALRRTLGIENTRVVITRDAVLVEDASPVPVPPSPVVEWSVGLDRDDVDALIAVGGGEALGDWDPARGLPFQRTDAGFRAAATLPSGVVLEYKLVARLTDGSYAWEARGNRYLLVEPGASAQLTWGA